MNNKQLYQAHNPLWSRKHWFDCYSHLMGEQTNQLSDLPRGTCLMRNKRRTNVSVYFWCSSFDTSSIQLYFFFQLDVAPQMWAFVNTLCTLQSKAELSCGFSVHFELSMLLHSTSLENSIGHAFHKTASTHMSYPISQGIKMRFTTS